jgi:3-hydroxyacyl-CoA dehydrogenase
VKLAKAAVVGAGTMGGGIAQVFSARGVPVVVKDIDQGQLDLARDHAQAIYQRQVERGRMSEQERQQKLALITYTLTYDGLRDVDLVVEAVPENMAVKKSVLGELSRVCRPDTIFASNTSALSITEMGVACGRPAKMIGMHFFNPAHVMKLVEVIPGAGTARATVDTVVDWARALDKTPVVVRECPGFLVNRLLMPYLNEAVVCFQEGAATAAQIDAALGPEGFGWPMGPMALMDMLGLDVCHHILAYLAEQYGERMREAVLLQTLVDAGRLGQKSGGGFYDYPGHKPSDQVAALIAGLQQEGVRRGGSASLAFSAERLVLLFLNEAFMCVQERIASVDDIDLACIAGLGMHVRVGGERVRMGPLAYADQVGLDVVVFKLEESAGRFGLRFAPAPILRDMVQAGRLGVKSGGGFKHDRTLEERL